MAVSSWGWRLGVACDVSVESVSYHPHCSPSWGDGCLGGRGGELALIVNCGKERQMPFAHSKHMTKKQIHYMCTYIHSYMESLESMALILNILQRVTDNEGHPLLTSFQ